MTTDTITFDVPTAFTGKSNMNVHSATKFRTNKGSSYTRFESNYIKKSNECAAIKQDMDWAMALFNAMQHNENQNSTTEDQSSGMSRRKQMYGIVETERKTVRKQKETVVQISTIPPKILTATTGFRSVASMISFIVIICNGDTTLMGKTTSSLTWLEEWCLYFERVYGRSLTRMLDCDIKYKLNVNILRIIFRKKLSLVLAARRRWPLFVTMSEDNQLRDPKWNSTYDNRRIIMWDNTDIKIRKPANLNLQRNTYSDYYGGNIAKGSVFVQLCGWLGTHELWEGAVTDTEYFRRSGILQLHQQFMEKYDPELPSIKWCSILDRGYKVVADCFAAAGQYCLQPAFSKPGVPKFSASDTQLTATVVADRGANERAVRMAKLSRYLKDGYKQTVSVEELCDVYLAWSWQVNFMYTPVL